jgi:hypothetical protein
VWSAAERVTVLCVGVLGRTYVTPSPPRCSEVATWRHSCLRAPRPSPPSSFPRLAK